MNDICTYRIRLDGQVEADEINTAGPLTITVERVDPGTTLLTVHTDQSGLIGLMRHLHGRGFTFLSVDREPDPIIVRS